MAILRDEGGDVAPRDRADADLGQGDGRCGRAAVRGHHRHGVAQFRGVDADGGGIGIGQHHGARAGIDQHVDRFAFNTDIRLEMAAHRFVQYDLLFAASGRHHHRTAGHQATQQPVGEGLQVVAIEIDGYEAEDNH